MIFGKVDTSLRDHPKALAAGPLAMGVWLAALLYCRDQLTDGFLPDVAVATLFGGGNANLKAAKKLVEVGLFTRTDGGYMLAKYAEKNDTKATVSAAIDKKRESQKNWKERAKRASGDDGEIISPRSSSRSRSLSADLSPEGEPEREPRREPSAPRGATAPPDDIPITAELIAWADMAGASKPTKDHVQACLADARSKGQSFADWTERLKSWLLKQRGYDAKDRASARTGGGSPFRRPEEPPPRPYHAPGVEPTLAPGETPYKPSLAELDALGLGTDT